MDHMGSFVIVHVQLTALIMLVNNLGENVKTVPKDGMARIVVHRVVMDVLPVNVYKAMVHV